MIKKQKNITLSADQALIELARERAHKERSSLNDKFREWLEAYTSKAGSAAEYRQMMKRLRYAKSGRKFSRDEMNER